MDSPAVWGRLLAVAVANLEAGADEGFLAPLAAAAFLAASLSSAVAPVAGLGEALAAAIVRGIADLAEIGVEALEAEVCLAASLILTAGLDFEPLAWRNGWTLCQQTSRVPL